LEWTSTQGRKGGRMSMEGEKKGGKRERNSKNSKINKERRMLIKRLREKGWMIMNGGKEGDEEGSWTCTGGRGESVIDYILGKKEMKEEIRYLEIGDRIESDHYSVVAWMRRGERRRNGGGR